MLFDIGIVYYFDVVEIIFSSIVRLVSLVIVLMVFIG